VLNAVVEAGWSSGKGSLRFAMDCLRKFRGNGEDLMLAVLSMYLSRKTIIYVDTSASWQKRTTHYR
jgi:hypothetical protein